MPSETRSILHPPRRGGPARQKAAKPAPPPQVPEAPDPRSAAYARARRVPSLAPEELPSDSVLLSRFAELEADAESLAAEFNIRLDLLLDWLRAPETVRRLNALLEHRALIEQARRDIKRNAMLASIEQLHDRARSEGDHVEQRRAATVYLRFSRAADRPRRFGAAIGVAASAGPRSEIISSGDALTLSRFPLSYRTRSRTIRTTPILHEPPVILPEPDQPDPAASCQQATLTLLHRLQDSDNPNNGDGLRTLFNHFTPAMCERVEACTPDEFACTSLDAYHALLGHHSAILLPLETPGAPAPAPADAAPDSPRSSPPLAAVQRVDLTDIDGYRWNLALSFTRESAAHPWLVDQLILDKPPPPD